MLFLTTFFLILKCFLGIFVALISITISIVATLLAEDFLSNRNHPLLGITLGIFTFFITSSILLTLWCLYGMDFFFGV